MTSTLQNVFVDTAFWIALVVKQDQYHDRAQQWSLRITGQMTTSVPVLLETANALARPAWRPHGKNLINHILQRSDVSVAELSPEMWRRGWELYCNRSDKSWSLTDCISFLVMKEVGLVDSLTADEHFRQAGFRAVLLDEP